MSACSRTMARSTTWSMVVGAGGAGVPPRAAERSAAGGRLAGAELDAAAPTAWALRMRAGAVVCCAIALNPISREAVIIHFQVRITQILSARA